MYLCSAPYEATHQALHDFHDRETKQMLHHHAQTVCLHICLHPCLHSVPTTVSSLIPTPDFSLVPINVGRTWPSHRRALLLKCHSFA